MFRIDDSSHPVKSDTFDAIYALSDEIELRYERYLAQHRRMVNAKRRWEKSVDRLQEAIQARKPAPLFGEAEPSQLAASPFLDEA
jgi:hypothetical protein